MTRTSSGAVLPAVRHGSSLRRLVLSAALTVVWVSAVLLLSAGFVPQLDGSETELSIRITFLILGGLVATLPVVVVWLPHRRLVTQLVQAVLAVETPRPQVPPVSAWVGPRPVFQRLRWTAYTLVLIPLLTLLLSAANFWMYLDEDAAATVALVFSAVPLAFLVVTMMTPHRIVRGVQAGIDAGQVIPVRVPRRADRVPLLGSAQQSWFEACLPDGQSVVLRTPVRFAAEARGVLDAPDLLLVVGRGGHQGALIAPSRPEDAVWLLGPVPQVRVPRDVLRAFEEDAG